MSGFCGVTIAQAASTGNKLKRRVENSGVETVFESLVHVADFPEFVFDPARFHSFLIRAQGLGRRIILPKCFECSLGRQHAALDREMNALEARRVQEAGGVAKYHPAVTCD